MITGTGGGVSVGVGVNVAVDVNSGVDVNVGDAVLIGTGGSCLAVGPLAKPRTMGRNTHSLAIIVGVIAG